MKKEKGYPESRRNFLKLGLGLGIASVAGIAGARALLSEGTEKEKGGENSDESISGKYLIIATRHMIGFDKHETIIEVATTSQNVPFIPQASVNQVKEVLEY